VLRWETQRRALHNLNSQEKGAASNTQICSKPVRTCSRPSVTRGGAKNGPQLKTTPASYPQSWGWKNSTFRKHVKSMQNYQVHLPYKPFGWSTNTTPVINPQSWGWKIRTSKNTWNRCKTTRNTYPLSHCVDQQKLPPLSTPEVGVEKIRPSKNTWKWCKIIRYTYPLIDWLIDLYLSILPKIRFRHRHF